MNVAEAMHRNYNDMVKYALLSPFYWGLRSMAAWRGLLQLFKNPHFWKKLSMAYIRPHRMVTSQ